MKYNYHYKPTTNTMCCKAILVGPLPPPKIHTNTVTNFKAIPYTNHNLDYREGGREIVKLNESCCFSRCPDWNGRVAVGQEIT